MARPRPEKRRQENKPASPAPPAEHRVLSMELQIGDRLADETGGWGVVGQPSTPGGKNARVRVQRVGEPRCHHIVTDFASRSGVASSRADT